MDIGIVSMRYAKALMEYASASRVTAGTAPLIPWVRVFMISWNGIPSVQGVLYARP